MLEALDTTLNPTNNDDLSEILEWAYKSNDQAAETHALELKSYLPLSGKDKRKSFAKIIKFIMASANRSERLAMSDFHGYGIMVIGVSEGQICPVDPNFEEQEFYAWATQFFDGVIPTYRFKFVEFYGKTVVVVLVNPPENGQPVYICGKDYEGLVDGAVYYRGTNNSSTAKGIELREIIDRSRGGIPRPNLNVIGSFVEYAGDWTADRSAINRVAGYFINELQGKKKQEEQRKLNNPVSSIIPMSFNHYGHNEPTIDEQIERINNWEPKWSLAKQLLLEVVAPTVQFTIENQGSAALKNPYVEIIVPKAISLLEPEDVDDTGGKEFMFYPWRVGISNDPNYQKLYVSSTHQNLTSENNSEGMQIRWNLSKNLSPGRTDIDSFEPAIVQVQNVNDDEITIEWKIYADNLAKCAQGKLQVPVFKVNFVRDLFNAVKNQRRLGNDGQEIV